MCVARLHGAARAHLGIMQGNFTWLDLLGVHVCAFMLMLLQFEGVHFVLDKFFIVEVLFALCFVLTLLDHIPDEPPL